MAGEGERCEARHVDVDPEFLPEFPDQSLLRKLARFDRAAWLAALAGMGSREAIPMAAALLQDTDSDMRVRAAEALGGIGIADDAVRAHLEKGLADQVPAVRVAAARAWRVLFADRGPERATIRALAREADYGDAREAALALAADPGAAATETLVALLPKGDERFTEKVALLLAAPAREAGR
jgi:HEAT repeat protein